MVKWVVASDTLYIFIHIPKCAGSTFSKHIEKNFAPGEYLDDDSDKNKVGRKVKVIVGHETNYGIHKKSKKKPYYFTFVRDPVSRVISFYNYWMTNYLSEKVEDRKKEIYKKYFLADGKVPDFATWLDVAYNEPGYDKALPSMPKFLKRHGFPGDLSKFDFVGITENFNEDAMFLYAKLGINKFFVNQNVSRKVVDEKEIGKVKGLLEKKTQVGRELYKKAQELNNKFKRGNKKYYQVVKDVSARRARRLVFDQVVYDFGGTVGYLSSQMRKRSFLYDSLLDKIKGRV